MPSENVVQLKQRPLCCQAAIILERLVEQMQALITEQYADAEPVSGTLLNAMVYVNSHKLLVQLETSKGGHVR